MDQPKPPTGDLPMGASAVPSYRRRRSAHTPVLTASRGVGTWAKEGRRAAPQRNQLANRTEGRGCLGRRGRPVARPSSDVGVLPMVG